MPPDNTAHIPIQGMEGCPRRSISSQHEGTSRTGAALPPRLRDARPGTAGYSAVLGVPSGKDKKTAKGREVVKIQIPIFQISVNDGRREADQDAVQELADSIAELGLINPITVDQDYTLIAGLHRLEAAKQLGWTEIECTVSSLGGLLAELAEIDENFVRKDLSDDEFRELLLQRKEIYESLHPETRRGMRNGQTSKTADSALLETKSFVQDTAEKLGKAPRTIEVEVQTAKNLTPAAKEIIRMADTKINKTSALKLSRLSPEQQKEAAAQLVTGEIHSVDEYHSAPADTEVLASSPAPPASEGYYPTIRDSVADLKNPDKDRRTTPDSFLVTFSYFLQRFCQGMESYTGPEYDEVLPILTQEHLNLIEQKIQLVHDALDELFNKIEGKVPK